MKLSWVLGDSLAGKVLAGGINPDGLLEASSLVSMVGSGIGLGVSISGRCIVVSGVISPGFSMGVEFAGTGKPPLVFNP